MRRVVNSFFLLIFANSFLIAQNAKLDKIVKKDYDLIEATITKISEKEVQYIFPNETITNVLDVSFIAKIFFKSGRIQSFITATQKKEPEPEHTPNNVSDSNMNTVQKLAIKENTIAILPVPFLNLETLNSSTLMSKKAQDDIYSILVERASKILPLTVQDLRITNNLLKKAGVDYTTIDEIPIEDLRNILGVDHLIAIKVDYTIKISSGVSTTTKSTTVKVSEDQKNNDNIKVDDFTKTAVAQSHKSFDFKVYFDIYRGNSKIYSKSREPFFSMKDSWADSFEYLLKRSPIYVR